MQLTDEEIMLIDEAIISMEEHVETVLGKEFLEQWLGTTMIANGIQMIEDDLDPQDMISSGLTLLEKYL